MKQLLDFQKRWAKSTSAPLRFLGEGRAEVPEGDYDRSLLGSILPGNGVAASARLGAYRQQYWFRLITLLQKAFPLLGHLLGWEEFNPHAARFLVDHPPTDNLDLLGSAFPSWLRTHGLSAMLVEAARVDLAWNEAFGAEDLPRPTEEDQGRLGASQAELVLQPSVRILSTSRDWFSLRLALARGEPAPSGPPRALRGVWVVSRTGSILRAEPAEPLLARILRGMRRTSWIEAMEGVVATHPEAAGRIPEWFSRGQSLGWWGIQDT